MRKIVELERKTKIEFEHVRAKTKNSDEDAVQNKSLTMSLECDQKEK